MRRTTVNLTPATDEQIYALKDKGFSGITEIVRVAIDRMYQQECAIPKREGREFGYILKIYTWPAAAGAPVALREHWHPTAQSARAHLDRITHPYAYASLAKEVPEGQAPCDWDGKIVPWNSGCGAYVQGTNGPHPARAALDEDWSSLIAEVRQAYNKTGEGMIHIAGRLLRERHPQTMGHAERLAWEAAGENQRARNAAS